MQLSRRRTKEIASLTHRKYRKRNSQYIVEGVRGVEAALAAGHVLDVVTIEAADRNPEIDRLLASVESFVTVDEATFRRFSDVETSQGIVAVVKMEDASPGRLLDLDRVLALDAIQDPGNLGTIIRTAAWFGIEGVVAGPGTVDFYNPKTVRAAMGGLFDVTLAETNDLALFLDEAIGRGFRIYGADLYGKSVDSWRPSPRSILVLGNEGRGISPAVQKCLSDRVTIGGAPTRGVESLNVGQAATIMMYEWSRRVSE